MQCKATVEPLLDELTTVVEVYKAVDKAIEQSSEAKVFVLKANSRGQKMPMVALSSNNADALLAKDHLRISWVSCKIRPSLAVLRCF